MSECVPSPSGRGNEARPSRGAFAPPLPSRKRVYDHRGFHPPQCITVAFLPLSGCRPLPKTPHCRLSLLDSIHECTLRDDSSRYNLEVGIGAHQDCARVCLSIIRDEIKSLATAGPG